MSLPRSKQQSISLALSTSSLCGEHDVRLAGQAFLPYNLRARSFHLEYAEEVAASFASQVNCTFPCTRDVLPIASKLRFPLAKSLGRAFSCEGHSFPFKWLVLPSWMGHAFLLQIDWVARLQR